jgi:CRP-like cAMP-binding protein
MSFASSSLFDLVSHQERERFLRFITTRQENIYQCHLLQLKSAFQQWFTVASRLKKLQQEEEQKKKVLEVLKTSIRGSRSTMEKEVLRRFIITNLSCIPKSVSFSEMDQLCNELDWYPLIGRSIIFLQGDFGNVYYMVANGNVGLFLEPSKDREMAIAREFGAMRAHPFLGTDEDLKRLGNNILTLPAGAGFGEYAILASTNKIRSCAAVSLTEDTILMIMHAETYNAVLRQHHYRQKQLSSATSLLQELPLFKGHHYSKIASMAYTMRSQSYSSGTVIAKYGEVINNVLLVASGQVKVFAPPDQQQSQSHSHSPQSLHHAQPEKHKPATLFNEKRFPKLAVAMLGRGQIIGDIEISMKGIRTFQMTYETCSATTEILEMPVTTFKEAILSNLEIRQSALYKSIEDINEEKEQRRVGRLTRAYDAVKKMMEGNSAENKIKEELLSVLPTIIDNSGSSSATSGGGGVISPQSSSKSRKKSIFSAVPAKLLEENSLSLMPGSVVDRGNGGSDSVKVTRKTSFSVKNPDDLNKIYEVSNRATHSNGSAADGSGKLGSGKNQPLSSSSTATAAVISSSLLAKSPDFPRKSNLLVSPKKLSFASR